MENGLFTDDGTKVLTVEELDNFLQAVPEKKRVIFEINVITGLPEFEIYSRQGHDIKTSLNHYQALSFTDYELRDIEKRLLEWGIMR